MDSSSLEFAWLELCLLNDLSIVSLNSLSWISWDNLHWLGIIVIIVTLTDWVFFDVNIFWLWDVSVGFLSFDSWGFIVSWENLNWLFWLVFVEVVVWGIIWDVVWVLLASLGHIVVLEDWLLVVVSL